MCYFGEKSDLLGWPIVGVKNLSIPGQILKSIWPGLIQYNTIVRGVRGKELVRGGYQ